MLGDVITVVCIAGFACAGASGTGLPLFATFGFHLVPEGHVGAYWTFGKLTPQITDPGIHFAWPFVTRMEPIQITMQTDAVMDIPCGTKGGVVITFDRVEVVNRLKKNAVYETLSQYGTQYDKTWIYDKVHHEINQFCSSNSLQDVYIDKFAEIDEIMQKALQDGCAKHAPGIEIIAVRVTKPRVPKSVLANYEAMESERTKVLVAQQHQRLVTIETETQKQKELAEAEKRRVVAETRLQQEKMELDARLAARKAEAVAEAYVLEQKAAANQKLHTREFLLLRFAEAWGNTSKVFVGPSINSFVSQVQQVADMMLGKGDAAAGKEL